MTFYQFLIIRGGGGGGGEEMPRQVSGFYYVCLMCNVLNSHVDHYHGLCFVPIFTHDLVGCKCGQFWVVLNLNTSALKAILMAQSSLYLGPYSRALQQT